MQKIKAVQYGCGPIGCRVAGYALQRPDIAVVGAIDTDPALVGLDLADAAGLDRKTGLLISDRPGDVFTRTEPDLAFLTTSSSLETSFPQLEECLKAGLNVVSTCEELAFPWRKAPELAAKLDRSARQNRVTVLGTGINPGFLMDAWPLFMSGVCQRVERIRAARVQDASSRRGPFQKKIGAGCTPEEFRERVAAGTLCHVGLAESVAMIALGLGWELDEIREEIEPVIATEPVTTAFVSVAPGQAAGVRQVGRGIKAGKEVITLDFTASVGAPESYDAVYITGLPDMEVFIPGGTHGDIATAAIVVNSACRVVAAPPGLLTMLDLPPVTAPGKL